MKKEKAMIEYKVGINYETKELTVIGPFDENIIIVDIPENDPLRKQYIDLFLHKGDIDRGIIFLKSISSEYERGLNEGLFTAGLNSCFKCFKYSKKRSVLQKTVIFKDSPDSLRKFETFERLRDKYFHHDDSNITKCIAFLAISPKEDKLFGGPPSVIWNRPRFDFPSMRDDLYTVMLIALKYTEDEIDRIAIQIEQQYSKLNKEKLLCLNRTQFEPAYEDYTI
jgi:hypothetical protein